MPASIIKEIFPAAFHPLQAVLLREWKCSAERPEIS